VTRVDPGYNVGDRPDERNRAMTETTPSDETRATESDDAKVRASADDMPTEEEDAAAARAGDLDDDVADNYKDAIERGARQKGEGRIP
jgi:hypothetical protein